jgi:hypothetical protein
MYFGRGRLERFCGGGSSTPPRTIAILCLVHSLETLWQLWRDCFCSSSVGFHHDAQGSKGNLIQRTAWLVRTCLMSYSSRGGRGTNLRWVKFQWPLVFLGSRSSIAALSLASTSIRALLIEDMNDTHVAAESNVLFLSVQDMNALQLFCRLRNQVSWWA